MLTSPAPRLLPWPAVASPDAEARLRHLVAGALRTGRPLALWREPEASQPRLLVARSLEAAYAGLPPALDAISALLVEAARLRAEEERLHEELREAHAERDRARLTTSYRIRRKVVTSLEDSTAGRGTLDAYRRVRGRTKG